MITLLLFALSCIVAKHSVASHESEEKRKQCTSNEHPSYKGCSISRWEALECASKYGDADNDGSLSPCEIQSLKSGVLDPLEQFLAWFYSMKKIMSDCDWDGDGKISRADLQCNTHTCLIECSNAELLNYRVCQPARKMNYKPKLTPGCSWNNKTKSIEWENFRK